MTCSAQDRRRARAFTLMELLVAIVVIGVLIALLITGLNAAGKFARKAAAQQTISALQAATNQFKDQFRFLPPLVHDGADMGIADPVARGAFDDTGPVYQDRYGRSLVNVYKLGEQAGRDFLKGSTLPPNQPYQDARYSKFSLPFYLMGALDASVDGVDGLGMVTPAADGSWVGVGDAMSTANKRFDPLMEGGQRSARIQPNYVDAAEIAELNGSNPTDLTNRSALVDASGRAYRYYRWLHEDTVQNTADLNIPAILLDPITVKDAQGNPTIDVTDGNAELRSATWAIVGAGPNGLFGTEEIGYLRSKMSLPGRMSEVRVRQEAASDNLVGVGQ